MNTFIVYDNIVSRVAGHIVYSPIFHILSNETVFASAKIVSFLSAIF